MAKQNYFKFTETVFSNLLENWSAPMLLLRKNKNLANLEQQNSFVVTYLVRELNNKEKAFFSE